MKNRSTSSSTLNLAVFSLVMLALGLFPQLGFASFESSLIGIKSKLTLVILPVLSVIGLGFAAISFFTGNPNAKNIMVYAILGCIFGFGAEAIVDMIASTVR